MLLLAIDQKWCGAADAATATVRNLIYAPLIEFKIDRNDARKTYARIMVHEKREMKENSYANERQREMRYLEDGFYGKFWMEMKIS